MTQTLAEIENAARDELFEAAWLCLSAQETFWKTVRAAPTYANDDVHTVCCLGRYYTDRGRGILTLGVRGFDWDADILVRTLYECAAKIFLITLADEKQRAELVDEFWQILPEFSDRKRARKAALAEAVFPPDDPSRDVFALMRDQRMVRSSRNLTKAERRQLEGKWSFSEIVDHLAKTAMGDDIRALLHMYGMNSHLAHVDHVAMDLMFDRAIRPPDELLTLRLGHASRIASDVSSLGYYCAHLTSRIAELDLVTTNEIAAANERVVEIVRRHGAKFHESQVAFYDRMFNRTKPSGK